MYMSAREMEIGQKINATRVLRDSFDDVVAAHIPKSCTIKIWTLDNNRVVPRQNC
jgi:hypothetical protein